MKGTNFEPTVDGRNPANRLRCEIPCNYSDKVLNSSGELDFCAINIMMVMIHGEGIGRNYTIDRGM